MQKSSNLRDMAQRFIDFFQLDEEPHVQHDALHWYLLSEQLPATASDEDEAFVAGVERGARGEEKLCFKGAEHNKKFELGYSYGQANGFKLFDMELIEP